MRIKSVYELNVDEILAKSIQNEENEVLISEGTIIKKEYIPLICSLGIDFLMIKDPYEHLEKPNTIINRNRLDFLVGKVRNLMERHIYHENKSLHEFEMIANEIVKEINHMPENSVIDIHERIADLYEHTVMVTLLSVSIAKRLHLDMERQYKIALGCLLHDIGIRYITTGYTNRDWKSMSPEEIFEFKKHTILGYSALDEETWVPEISRKMILSHHENLEGSGFPMHWKSNEIECRIIQACDAFDCYISGMECKRMSVQNALSKMKEEAGKKYDEKIIEILVSKIAQYPVGTIVKMDNQTEGVVISQTTDPKNPIILVLKTEVPDQKYNLMLEKNISILQIL